MRNKALTLAVALIPSVALAADPYGGSQRVVGGKQQVDRIAIPVPFGQDLGRSLYAYPRLSDYHGEDDVKLERLTVALEALIELMIQQQVRPPSGDPGVPGGLPGLPGRQPPPQQQSWLAKNCGACHISKNPPDAGFSLAGKLTRDQARAAARRVNLGEMPPAGPLGDQDRLGTVDELFGLIQ